MKILEGELNAQNLHVAIVAARFNSFITDRLVEGAVDTLVRLGANENDLTLVKVPGAWEIPSIVKRLLAQDEYDAIICLGAVIRGGTPHFDYVAAEVSKGVAHLSLESSIPITFGVLTTDTVDQAIERAGTKAGNKGAEAAQAVVEMARLHARL